MTALTTPLRIYVASLSDYNAGRLHGVWIDLEGKTEEDIWAEINAMLKLSKEPIAEEYAIHDYEGFGQIPLSEYASVSTIAKLVEAIDLAYNEEALIAYVSYDSSVLHDCDDAQDLVDSFQESFAGEADSDEEFARNLVEDLGLPGVGFVYPETGGWHRNEERPSWSSVLDDLASYLDWEAIAQAQMSDCWSVKGERTTYYFRSV